MLFISRKPGERNFVRFEGLVVVAEREFVEEFARLFTAERLILHICNRRARRQNRTFHHRRAAEHHTVVVLAFFDVALTEHTAVAMSEINHGKIVSVFEHFGDCTLVLNGVEIDIAFMIALYAFCGLLGARHTVSTVVVGKTINPFSLR